MQALLALMIPILALMIPITAILVHSPLGKAFARRLEADTQGASQQELRDLRQRVLSLETQAAEQKAVINQLQESSEFYQKLLDKPPA